MGRQGTVVVQDGQTRHSGGTVWADRAQWWYNVLPKPSVFSPVRYRRPVNTDIYGLYCTTLHSGWADRAQWWYRMGRQSTVVVQDEQTEHSGEQTEHSGGTVCYLNHQSSLLLDTDAL